MKDNKKMLQLFSIVALFLAVVGVSIGFAALSTSLQISGTAKVVPATWKVEFLTPTFSNNSTDAKEADGVTPTVNATTFSGYQIVLTKPGDKGTYTVPVKNNGSIPAKITSVSLGSTLTYTGTGDTKTADEAAVTGKIIYDVTWDDGTAIATNDTLAVGETKNIIVEVTYDSTATTLPTNPVVIGGRDLTVVFEQA